MGLILGVRKGTTFYVNDVPVRVTALDGFKTATLLVHDKEVMVYDDKMVEILPNVKVQCGMPSEDTVIRAERKAMTTHSGDRSINDKFADLVSRLLIEAPRSITILRERLYRQNHELRNQRGGFREGGSQRDRSRDVGADGRSKRSDYPPKRK